MERKYTAIYDNGRDCNLDFEFFSEHKANSQANIKDAYEESKRKWGRNHYVKILKTILQ